MTCRHGTVPGIFFTGEKDLELRVSIIDGLFAINRRAGALWAYIKEPGARHEVSHSREFAVVLFEDVLAMRISADGQLRSIGRQASSPIRKPAPCVLSARRPRRRTPSDG